MRHLSFVLFFIIIGISELAYSQVPQRMADINAGTGSSILDEYNVVIALNEKLIFSANDGIHGYEVWIYDGNEASLLKDIYTGPGHSKPQNYFLINDKVIFTAQDSAHHVEWWSTDGTPEGTQLVKDIMPGAGGGVFRGTNNRAYFYLYNGSVYFAGANRPNDFELWKTDGTSTGTVLVKNISPDGGSTFFPSYPENFAEHNGTLFFSCREGFWKTNGTTSGTVLVEDEDPEDVFGLEPDDLISNGEYLLFIQNTDLWRSDGTSAGTIKIKDLGNVNLNWLGNRFTVLGNLVLFPGSDAEHGEELWRTDGTAEGTSIVVDLKPGTSGYAPQNNIAFKNKMYYKGDNGNSGIEFWSSDGSEAGTKLIKDIEPGSSSGFFLPTEIYTDGELIYMSAGKSFNKELWISDGSTAGTYEVAINPNGDSHPSKFYRFGDKLFFFATSDDLGSEPFLLDLMSTAIEDVPQNSPYTVYPNPTDGLIQIVPFNSDAFHSILSLDGHLLIEKVATETIDLSAYPTGIYILRSCDYHTGIIAYKKIVLVK